MNNRAVRRQIRKRKLRLEREAHRFAAEAQLFADRVSIGGPYAGDVSSLVKAAFRVVSSSAWLDGMNEILELEEEDEDQTD